MREKTNLTLHPSIKAAAINLAACQGRSLSELVERLLERELEKSVPPTYDGLLREEPQYTAKSDYYSTAPTPTDPGKKTKYSLKPKTS